MTRQEFESGREKLENDMIDAAKRHFEELGTKFDTASFLAETRAGLDEIVRNAYFYGAEMFPIWPWRSEVIEEHV